MGIGASAGGLEPLVDVVRALPAGLPAAVFVVMHFRASRASALPELLARATKMAVRGAEDGERLGPGRIYVARPDHHLLVQRGVVRVMRGPRENGHRPSVDPMLRSLARTAGPASAGVVLSGALSDGAAGMLTVSDHGGLTVVQDPGEAAVPSMPQSTLDVVPVDAVLPADKIGTWLVEQIEMLGSRSPIEEEPTGSEELAVLADVRPEDGPTTYVCPDCGGVLNHVNEERMLRFRCQVGHQWSGEDLRAALDERVEEALWVALRILDEQIKLDEQLLERARLSNRHLAVAALERRLAERRASAEPLWKLVTG